MEMLPSRARWRDIHENSNSRDANHKGSRRWKKLSAKTQPRVQARMREWPESPPLRDSLKTKKMAMISARLATTLSTSWAKLKRMPSSRGGAKVARKTILIIWQPRYPTNSKKPILIGEKDS